MNGGVGLVGAVSPWNLEVILLGGSGPTKWVNGNVAYPGIGNPGSGVIDGDPALVIASSTATKKIITFGTIFYTLVTVIVRIGLPIGSAVRFTGITPVYL
jgi:hypothetical protein